MLILLLFFLNCAYCKYFYNHIIKTDFKSVNELSNIMTSKNYFDLYLEEVKADNITYDPCLNDSLLEYPFEVSYNSKPKVTLLPLTFPKINIKQSWKKENNIMKGRIVCSFIDFNLDLEIKQNDSVYIDINSCINSKMFFLPNKVLKYALYDYENIFHKIIKKLI
tara:strand:+ start:31 stop:525 length:495 start_codon:yes stop_codon:yes gene_type:complete